MPGTSPTPETPEVSPTREPSDPAEAPLDEVPREFPDDLPLYELSATELSKRLDFLSGELIVAEDRPTTAPRLIVRERGARAATASRFLNAKRRRRRSTPQPERIE